MRNQLRTLSSAAAVIIAITAAACGSSSPTSPTSGNIASVTIAGTTVAAGNSIQGTVTLATAAGANGATVGLSSSNTAVATVSSSVDIPAGATTGSFVVWGVASGSVTITASMGGGSRQSSPLSVSTGLRLSSISVNPTTVVGGTNVTATVTLTGPAPNGGAAVTLSSDGVAIVPALATVISGDSSVSFNVLTQAVTSPTTATIHAAYGGASQTATISLTRPSIATANFGVTGAQVTETCAVISNGAALDCTFDGSSSSAPGNITAYDWTWAVAGTSPGSVLGTAKTQTTSGPILSGPSFNCSMLPPPPLPAMGALTMTVTLKIHDDAGNVSPVATNTGVRLLPQGSCGY
jgi:hypothetical protein